MAKRWSATSLLTVALLGCLVGREIEAQVPAWQNQMSKGSPPPQAPQIHQPPPPPKIPQIQPPPPPKTPQYPEPPPRPQYPQFPPKPQVLPPQPPPAPKYPKIPEVPPPQPPQVPTYPQRQEVSPPQPPQVPTYPQRQEVSPPQPPQYPKYPQRPEVPPPQPPQYPKYPQRPEVPPPQPPQYPKYPQRPEVPPPQPPQVPKYPQRPEVLPPQPPPAPKYPQRQEVSPPQPPQYPKYPQRPEVPPPQPPQFPKYPQRPEVLPPQPPQVPKYPQRPEVLPPQPPQVPKYPQRPEVLPPQPPQVPKYPQRPEVLPPQPPQFPKYPQRPEVLPPQPPQVPKYPQRPEVLPPQPPQFPKYPQRPEVLPPQPPQVPKYPQRPEVLPPQPPQVPKYPQRPESLPPQTPEVPKYPKWPQVRPPPKYPYPRGFTNYQSPQEPQVPEPQQPQGHTVVKTIEPKNPSFQSCEVGVSQRVPCGHTDISAAACEAIGCCFAGQQCYFGKAVTIQCTKDAQFIVVVARDATLPNIDLESISLLGQGQGCTHVDSNSDFAIYQFPVTACGSVVMEEPGVLIYENRMTSSFEVGVGELGVITRDTHYELLFQCRYIGTSVETLVIEVLPLDNPPLPVAALGPIGVHLRLANGQCNSKGCNEVDVAYTSFYADSDYPVTKVLRDPVYVEVQLLDKADPNLVLTLGRCWTTTSPNPHSLPQWDILIDGCPNRDDRYLSSLVPVGPHSGLAVPSHVKRFIFYMFTFVDQASMEPMKEHVYIHCSTAVCTASSGHSCEPSCYRHKRDVEAVAQETVEPKVVASVGPMIMNLPKQ